MVCRDALFSTVQVLAKQYRHGTDLETRQTWASEQAEADEAFASCVGAIEWNAEAEAEAAALLLALEALRQTRVNQARAGSVAEYNALLKLENRHMNVASDRQNDLRNRLGLPPIRPFWRTPGDPPSAFPAE